MATHAKRILVTGGAGFIGSHIVEQLVHKGPAGGTGEVVVLDNFTRGNRDNLAGAMQRGRVTIVEGDINDVATVKDVMDGIDEVYHMAALRITQCAEEPRKALEALVDGAFNVFEAAVNAKVSKVVAASSASVYGLADHFPTPEDQHPYNNRTFYGAAKTFNEGMLRSFNEMYGLKYVALRYFNAYGPHMDAYGKYTEVLIRWMERLADGLPPLIFGNGKQTMDFVYVGDIARANILAAESNETDAFFNVASGTETSLLQLAQALTKVMVVDIEPEFREERAVNPVPRRLADTRLAAEKIGFRAEVSLEEGLRRLVEWLRGLGTRSKASLSPAKVGS